MLKKKSNNIGKFIFLAIVLIFSVALVVHFYPLLNIGLKTYTNFKYGYQIKVPAEWHIYSQVRESTGLKCVENYELANEVFIFKNKTEKCASEQSEFAVNGSGFFDKDINYPNGGRVQKPITVGGMRAYEDDFTDDHSVVAIKLNHSNESFLIYAKTNYDYNKILSSFTFLSQEQLAKLPFPTPFPPKFTKRFIKPADKIINFTNYPSEIINVDETKLVGMSQCETYGSSVGIPNVEIRSNPLLKTILGEIDKTDILSVKYVAYCQLEDGRTFVGIYTFHNGLKSGFTDNIAYLGILKDGHLDIRLKYDPGTGAGYPSIGFSPLEFTDQNILYYAMGIGDAISVVQIHKVDLNNKTHSILLTCRDSYYVENGKDIPNPSCN